MFLYTMSVLFYSAIEHIMKFLNDPRRTGRNLYVSHWPQKIFCWLYKTYKNRADNRPRSLTMKRTPLIILTTSILLRLLPPPPPLSPHSFPPPQPTTPYPPD